MSSSSYVRRALLPLVLLCIAFVPLAAQRGTSGINRTDLVRRLFDARIVRVADADTLDAVVVGESKPIRIRLEGIDAPEQSEVFSREAAARLRALVFDRVVRVHGKSIDRYGRLIARVIANGTDASRDLVRAGLACHAYAYDPLLAADESAARTAAAGFWGKRAKPACVTRTAFSARVKNDGA